MPTDGYMAKNMWFTVEDYSALKQQSRPAAYDNECDLEGCATELNRPGTGGQISMTSLTRGSQYTESPQDQI